MLLITDNEPSHSSRELLECGGGASPATAHGPRTLKKLSENNFLDDFYYLMTMKKTSYMLEIGKKKPGA
jgi:hypothetical protein